jgi:phosphatidylethanolamine/phosphatidyl-N-methylethanolamine N-methyltransferase
MTSPDAGHNYWERNAERYDRSMKLLGRPIPTAAAWCSEAVRGAQVLEVAAGTGLITAALAATARSVVATDYSSAMVEQLKARVSREGLSNVTCEAADIYALPFEAASFDVVVAANVLHIVPDLPRALAALKRMLKPGGRLIAPTYCHDETPVAWALSRLVTVTGFPGQRRFTASGLQQAIQDAGFCTLRVTTIAGILPLGYVEAQLD